ncbi:MAG: hypothetical protein IKJ37_03240 [Kiritimatiellae bacterium]|nr:hypothetical protein [Kiritimatiellia bacterium]
MKNEKQRKRVRRVDAKRTALGRFLCRLLGDEAGQTIMEYVVLGVMVVAAVVGLVLLFGDQLRVGFNKMIAALRGDPTTAAGVTDVNDTRIDNARTEGDSIASESTEMK